MQQILLRVAKEKHVAPAAGWLYLSVKIDPFLLQKRATVRNGINTQGQMPPSCKAIAAGLRDGTVGRIEFEDKTALKPHKERGRFAVGAEHQRSLQGAAVPLCQCPWISRGNADVLNRKLHSRSYPAQRAFKQ